MVIAQNVLEAVCETCGVTMQELRSGRRFASVSKARRIACRVLRSETDMSYPEIQAALGLASHATVVRAVQRVLPEDEVLVELTAAVAHKKWNAHWRSQFDSRWAQPAVPARWLVASKRKLEAKR